MVARCPPTVVASPCWSTVTTWSSLLRHSAQSVTSRVVPSASRPIAWCCWVWPGRARTKSGMTSMPVNSGTCSVIGNSTTGCRPLLDVTDKTSG